MSREWSMTEGLISRLVTGNRDKKRKDWELIFNTGVGIKRKENRVLSKARESNKKALWGGCSADRIFL